MNSKLDEERNLHLDKPGKGKSMDQLKKHSVDASFENKPIDRAVHILSMGDDVQKISIIHSLPQLCTIDLTATNSRIIPKIQQDLVNSSCEIQISTSRIFKVLVENQSNLNLLNSIIQGIEAKDPNVAYSWCDSLLAVIPTLNEDIIKNSILPIVKTKSDPYNSLSSKLLSCKLIGQISNYPKLKQIDIKKDILPLVLSLCQDPSADVRATICQNLPAVAHGIGPNFIKSNLLPSLVELACDENCTVRGSAILTITPILNYLDVDTKKQTILPLLKQLCDKSMRKDDTTSIVLAQEFGPILKGIQMCLLEGDILYLLKSYKAYSQRGKQSNMNDRVDASKEVMCRERCATNILIVLEFTMKIAPSQLMFVYSIFRELASDPCYLVRRAIAGSFADISKALGDQNKMLKNELVRLLRDDAIEVLDLLVPNVSTTLLSFCEFGTLSNQTSSQTTMDIGRALFKCQMELSKGYNWRLTVTFLAQLECLPFCMPSEFIHNNFTPVLLDRTLSGKAKPIKLQAIRTLVIFLRNNFKANQHKWLRDSLIKQIAYSNNSYSRMLYVHLCAAVLDTFSEKYFKEFFLGPLLTLTSDRIANVRYGCAQFSSRLKNMVTLQADIKSKQLINDVLLKLETSERQHFIMEVIKAKKKEPLQKRVDEKLKEEERRVAAENANVIKRPETLAIIPLVNDNLQTKSVITAQKTSVPLSKTVVSPKPATAPATAPARPNKPSIPANRISVQPQPAGQEMSFLQHHFYIDAGIKIPNDDTPDSNSINDGTVLIETTINNINTTNITDDLKVNLRKLSKSKLVQPKTYTTSEQRSKRYSSITLGDCIDKDKKVLNRRSLNINEISRIPVSCKTVLTKSEFNTKVAEQNLSCSESKIDSLKDNEEQVVTLYNLPPHKSSNLPVFKRRPFTAPLKKVI